MGVRARLLALGGDDRCDALGGFTVPLGGDAERRRVGRHRGPILMKHAARIGPREAVGADPSIWNFATADAATIDSLTRDFRVHRNNEGGVLNHTLCTALISPDGTVKRIWRGNAWTTEEVLAAAGVE